MMYVQAVIKLYYKYVIGIIFVVNPSFPQYVDNICTCLNFVALHDFSINLITPLRLNFQS
jgi:hypothetical protein